MKTLSDAPPTAPDWNRNATGAFATAKVSRLADCLLMSQQPLAFHLSQGQSEDRLLCQRMYMCQTMRMA